MNSRNIVLGMAGIIGAFVLLGVAFRAGQASVMMSNFDRFDGRGERFEGDFPFDSEEEFREFMEEQRSDFDEDRDRDEDSDRDRGEDSDRDRDRDDDRDRDRGEGRGERGHGRGHGHGHGHSHGDYDGRGHGYGRGGFGPGRSIGGIIGFLFRIAILAGVIWAVLNWSTVQNWWNRVRPSGTSGNSAATTDPAPADNNVGTSTDEGGGSPPNDSTDDGTTSV